ncbi:Lrp/AsnC family transcriptional regulator [Azospirillum sp. 412522]|nr:Lrp/AsnC family transcriptional regulator [Azospirillum sp. 412522]
MQIRKGRRAAGAGLDAVDEAIIDILRSNGRATNQEIADRLSITAGTVSARLNRLEESKAMKVVAVADFAAHGYNMLIATGVKVLGRPVAEVARELAALPEVFSLHLMNGNYDIEMLVILHEFQEINTFLLDHVAKIPGISEINPGIAANIAKFEFNVAPL